MQIVQASVSGNYSLGSNAISGDLRSVAAASPQSTETAQIILSDTLTIVGRAMSLSDDGTPSTAQFEMPFDLAFFEADGVTPVALSEVTAAPEPSTWASLAGGLVVLSYWRRRKVRR